MQTPTKRPRNKRNTPLNHEPEALEWALRKSGFTQAQLIVELERLAKKRSDSPTVSKGQLSDILKGNRNCRQPLLVAIATVLNCPVVALERKRDAA